jgi:hypothetical protein
MQMDARVKALITAALLAVAVTAAQGQVAIPPGPQLRPFDRLPATRFDAASPAARVSGVPGVMTIRPATCRTMPAADVRRRVVDVAVQEWAYFGFIVVDQLNVSEDEQETDDGPPPPEQRRQRRRRDPIEGARVAASIAGYWSATAEGTWIVGRQNDEWNDEGTGARWQYPWSAAFISWVMCEGGLSTTAQFQRAVAHHSYIDQAIRARDGSAASAAFVAYDKGEAAVEPGDLLCSARRPAYRTLAQRRRQMGEGARTHCDVVVKVDVATGRILAIGGNVRGAVALKLLPGTRVQGSLRSRLGFAHLKMRGPSIELAAMDNSPTMRALDRQPPI